MTFTDWIPVLQALIAAAGVLLSTVLSISIPFAIAAFERRTQTTVDAREIQNLHDAASTAAGILTTQLQQGLVRLSEIRPESVKVMDAAHTALATVPDSAKGQNVLSPQMARMIVARTDTTAKPAPPAPVQV